MTTKQRIDDFLGQKRLAMVGVSRNEKDFSRQLFREFQSRGYQMVPVNPDAGEIENTRCYQGVADIDPPVDGALLMTPAAVTDTVVHDCAKAGVRRVWMYRAVGPGSVSDRAVEFCEMSGIEVIPGYCPYMFLKGSGFVHSFHRGLLKLTGRYPH